MNFQQEPGFYKASNDELIMDYQTAVKENILKEAGNSIHNHIDSADTYSIKDKYYLILPDNTLSIGYDSFVNDKNIVGIYGKDIVCIREDCFNGCTNLETVEFPNLTSLHERAFDKCEKLEEKFTDKNGLFILNRSYLVSMKNYKNEELVVPSYVKTIARDAIEQNMNCLKKVVLPLKLERCTLDICNFITEEVILPIECDLLTFSKWNNTKLIYKGSKEQFKRLIDKGVIFRDDMIKKITIQPYKEKELFERIKECNYSLTEAESILDKKLSLDEILELNYTIKEANEYFKQNEVGKDEL